MQSQKPLTDTKHNNNKESALSALISVGWYSHFTAPSLLSTDHRWPSDCSLLPLSTLTGFECFSVFFFLWWKSFYWSFHSLLHLSDILGGSHYALLLLVLVLVLGIARRGRHAKIQFDETSDCFVVVVVCCPTHLLHYNYYIRFVVVVVIWFRILHALQET